MAMAVAVLRLDTLLSRQPRFAGQEVSFADSWKGHVMPHAISRGSGGPFGLRPLGLSVYIGGGSAA